MALLISVLGDRPAPLHGVAPWGSWSTQSWTDPAVLATDPDLTRDDVDDVLVLTAPAGAAQARLAGSLVGAVRPDLSVRVEVLPTSVAMMVRAVERVPASLTGPTAVHAAITRCVESAVWGAWLPSVAKLEKPNPTLRQHVRSWFGKGAGFLALHGDPGWVAKLPYPQVTAAQRLPRPTTQPSPDTPGGYECHAFGELPEEAIATLFAAGLGTRPQRREPFGDAAAHWGTGKAIEFVITQTQRADARASDVDLGEYAGYCPTCRESVWASCCPFCRVKPYRANNSGPTRSASPALGALT